MPMENNLEILAFHHLQSLKPFESSSGSSAIQLRFSVGRHAVNGIDFSFTLSGDTSEDLSGLVLPEVKPEASRERRDELWKHTCLEIFVGPEEGEETYLELNLAPTGDWNLYAFDSYRAGMRPAPYPSSPLVAFERSLLGHGLTWKGRLAPSVGDVDHILSAQSLVMGATAVLEYQNGAREYWALEHSGTKPDFHLRQSFRLRL